MRFKIVTIVIITMLTACRFNYQPANCAAGGYHVDITSDKTSYRLSPVETVRIRAVNQSACNIFYQNPSFFATLQRLENGRWKDLWPWYDIIAIVPHTIDCAPGGSIPVMFLTTDWDYMQKPGTYAIHLKLYTDKKLKYALPDGVCRSNIFEIVKKDGS